MVPSPSVKFTISAYFGNLTLSSKTSGPFTPAIVLLLLIIVGLNYCVYYGIELTQQHKQKHFVEVRKLYESISLKHTHTKIYLPIL